MTIWLTDRGGREDKVQVVDVSRDELTVAAGIDIRRLRIADIVRVDTRVSDGLTNGALIGTGAAVASGLLLCRSSEPWRNCRDDVGPMLRIGALGAALGSGIDALIRRRITLYPPAPDAAALQLTPLLAPRIAGFSLAVSF